MSFDLVEEELDGRAVTGRERLGFGGSVTLVCVDEQAVAAALAAFDLARVRCSL